MTCHKLSFCTNAKVKKKHIYMYVYITFKYKWTNLEQLQETSYLGLTS
jgi:hypothetical protein